MAKVLAILRHDIHVFLAQRSNLPGLLLIPAVMTVLIALVTGGDFDRAAIRRLDVIDRDGTQASSQFLVSIRQANLDLTLCPMDQTQSDIQPRPDFKPTSRDNRFKWTNTCRVEPRSGYSRYGSLLLTI